MELKDYIVHVPKKEDREILFSFAESRGYRIFPPTKEHSSIKGYPYITYFQGDISGHNGTKIEKYKEVTFGEYLDLLEKFAKKKLITPKCIVFEICCGDGDELGIVSDNQVLYYNEDRWMVADIVPDYFRTGFGLVECKREELEAGDTAFRCEEINDKELEWLPNYCKILGDKHVCWDGKGGVDVLTACPTYKWYKVSPLD